MKYIIKGADPLDLHRYPTPHELPDDVSRAKPLELFARQDELLTILDRNINQALKNNAAEMLTIVAQLRTFRDWVAAFPDKHLYIGLYPAPTYDEEDGKDSDT